MDTDTLTHMTVELITVTAENVDKTGFFCKMSARGKPGYERKLAWLKKRFAEGLEMRLLGDKKRGFVEFIPGEYAWRAIENAERYMIIHCLWVVGQSKRHGYGRVLMDEVIATAKARKFAGVAMVTSKGNWLAKPKEMAHFGLETVASCEPGFELMVTKFKKRLASPRFCTGWETKLAKLKKGVVVVRADQCPYIDDAANAVRDAADRAGLSYKEVQLESAADVRAKCPTPYGTFAIVKDRKLLTYCYQKPKELDKLLAQ